MPVPLFVNRDIICIDGYDITVTVRAHPGYPPPEHVGITDLKPGRRSKRTRDQAWTLGVKFRPAAKVKIR